MGQKVNPKGFRVGVIRDWDTRWYANKKDFKELLYEDYQIRRYVKAKLYASGVSKIEIERDNTGKMRVYIHCAKPGMIIGRDGAEIEKLRVDLEKMTGTPVSVNVIAVKPVEMSAQLVAENIASQLERRIGFRRAMKQAIGRTMRMGAKGIKITLSGRLGGAEIARTEHYHEGTIPLQTLRADIDYGFWEANTTYGKIGVKVWIFKGEVLPEVARIQTGASEERRQQQNRRNDRRGDRRDGRRGGDRRDSHRNFRDGGRGPRDNRAPRAPRENKEGGAR